MVKRNRLLGIFCLLPGILAVAGGARAEKPENILLVILDDYGAISAEAYQDQWKSARTGPTAVFNRVCRQGVRFTTAWSMPTCSPTRANILTGRYSFRTGVGGPCGFGNDEIRPDELTLPRAIRRDLPAMALGSIGKWHLGRSRRLGGDKAPNTMGWDHFAGLLAGGVTDYFRWNRTVNGNTATSSAYVTRQNVDDAIDFIHSVQGRPWLLWLGFIAPHTPIHLPPDDLHSREGLSGRAADIRRRPGAYYEAMVESTDRELQRLLKELPDEDGDGLPDKTMVIMLGDNGTSDNAGLPSPWEDADAKGSLAEHGSRIPLCIAGAGVRDPGRDVAAPVNVTDLYATVLDVLEIKAGDGAGPVDAVSLKPYLDQAGIPARRSWILSEQFLNLGSYLPGGVAIGDGRHRFVRLENGPESCFDAKADPLEKTNLLASADDAAKATCAGLRSTMLELVCSDPGSHWRSWCR